MIKTFKEYKQYTLNQEKAMNFVFDQTDNRYYYVYRISDITNNKHYYGSRVCKVHPSKDLGIKYFSSSRTLKPLAKENQQNFKFKVIKIFNNTKDKELYESYLHQYFNVKEHNSFYNKINQTPFGYDTTGLVSAKNKDGVVVTVSVNEFKKRDDLFGATKGLVTCKNINTNEIITTTKDEFYNRDDLVHTTKGTISCINTNTNETLRVPKEEFYNRDDLVHNTKDKVLVRDKNNNEFMIFKDDNRLINGDLQLYHTGLKRSDETKRKMSKFQNDFHSKNILIKFEDGNKYIDRNDPRVKSGEYITPYKGKKAWNKGIPLSKEQKDKMSKTMKGRVGTNKGKRCYYDINGKKYMVFKENKENLNLYTLNELKEMGIKIKSGSENRNKGKKVFYTIDGKRVLRYTQEKDTYTYNDAKKLRII